MTEITDDDTAMMEPMKDEPINSPVGIAAIALNMALKYYGITIVSDGTLYQQYKLEGRNIEPLDIATVLNTAKEFEQHLAQAPERMAKMVLQVINAALDAMPEENSND